MENDIGAADKKNSHLSSQSNILWESIDACSVHLSRTPDTGWIHGRQSIRHRRRHALQMKLYSVSNKQIKTIWFLIEILYRNFAGI